ncbi:MAG: hypothetical protein KDD98_06315 [Sphingomonadaceae bacterium]|nr:hypothetical protein [Sphingomonadaceae bacterium]
MEGVLEKEVERLRKEEPWLFETTLDYEYERVLKGSGAVQAWHATKLKGRDGKEFASIMVGDPPREVQANDPFSANRLTGQVRMDMIGSIVLIDSRLVPGKTIKQLADYATMRSFASVYDTSEGEVSPTSTILSLFDDGADLPDGMTPFDWAYLHALYKVSPNAGGDSLTNATWTEYKRRALGIAED